MKATTWPEAMKPLLKKYKNKKHPLEYKTIYQLVVMVVLSAQDSDKHINSLAPALFKAFPNMKALAKADEEVLTPFIGKVRNYRNKASWLVEMAKTIKQDKHIPLTMEELTAMKGIGRKSANVIMREAGVKAEGIIVDLHVVRVAPRLGIAKSTDPKKIEAELMAIMPQKTWGDIGMAISFLGRDTCRPSKPKHNECVVNEYCEFCQGKKII
ncbi:MAG: endonuclease III [Bacteroidota bacterium]